MSEFKKGVKVTLKKDSRYFLQCLGKNNVQLNGVIVDDNKNYLDFKYSVTWMDPNGLRTNTYREIDLEAVDIKDDKPKIDFLSIFTKEQKEALTNFINEQIETKLKKYE
jgi:hypothetical protein